ncbi:MAG: alginate lyase family protein [Acidobacteriaceae bacterium]|nr:alginate lyase family protein [Acidobacteriaceae bacterium]
MRGVAEITFRARQEAANLYLLASQPSFHGTVFRKLKLPNPQDVVDALRGSAYAQSVEKIANQLIAHRFPIFGQEIQAGPEIRWRRDYIHNVESDPAYFRRISYLNFSAVGDHKLVWELNRHQHLVLLAQAFLFTGNHGFLQEILAQLETWFEQNPFQRGINWASALEVAFRTLSWIWLYHFVGSQMPDSFRQKFLTGLYRHGRHLAENLSVYFSPNTHLLGEAVALYALAVLFPEFPGTVNWRKRSESIVLKQLDFQVRADGSHFEQSSYYHVYATDFFVFLYLIAGRPPLVKPTLERMAEYLHWLLGPSRRISFWGDDDGGRLFHPYGVRDEFGRATLATCGLLLGQDQWVGNEGELAEQAAWWLGADVLRLGKQQSAVANGSRTFADSGLVSIACHDFYLQMDCGPFGYGGAGHSHSDTLSLNLQYLGRPILIDPGTYTYISNQEERDWFRGSTAHNTVCIDNKNQGIPAGPFRWASKPHVVLKTSPGTGNSTNGEYIDAFCRYSDYSHRRRVLLQPAQLLVLDEIDGPEGDHICEQNWHLGIGASSTQFSFSAEAEQQDSEFSPVYGTKLPGRCLKVKQSGRFPIQMAMLFTPNGESQITTAEAARILGAYS